MRKQHIKITIEVRDGCVVNVFTDDSNIELEVGIVDHDEDDIER